MSYKIAWSDTIIVKIFDNCIENVQKVAKDSLEMLILVILNISFAKSTFLKIYVKFKLPVSFFICQSLE